MRFDSKIVRWAAISALAVAVAAAALGYAAGPRELSMGAPMRIGYLHIGAAWTAYLAYVVTAIGAVMTVRRRDPRWDRLALASAEWGLVLTTITLMTGSLWGKSVNNWWWQWSDSRLTLTLFLWFLYAGYLSLRHFTEGERRASLSAILAIAGVPTIILNHFAVRLFPTFHPTSVVVREGAPAAEPVILNAIIASALIYLILYIALLAARIGLEERRDRLSQVYAER